MFIKKILGWVLITVGIVLLCIIILLTQMSNISPQKQTVVLTQIPSEVFPVKIDFDSRNPLDITRGKYQFNSWKLDDKHPVYLQGSGIPGENGNIVIYGHNKKEVFGHLNQVKLGDQISILTNQGETLIYSVDSIKDVFPYQVDVLKPTDFQKITLFTCSGIFDSKRLVISGTRV